MLPAEGPEKQLDAVNFERRRMIPGELVLWIMWAIGQVTYLSRGALVQRDDVHSQRLHEGNALWRGCVAIPE